MSLSIIVIQHKLDCVDGSKGFGIAMEQSKFFLFISSETKIWNLIDFSIYSEFLYQTTISGTVLELQKEGESHI